MNLGVRNRVAIVTGSSRGIGKAIAYGLAEEGAKVTICVRSEERLRETSREITASTGTEVLPVRADLKEKEDIKSMIKITAREFGRIDILVNNTGSARESILSHRHTFVLCDALALHLPLSISLSSLVERL